MLSSAPALRATVALAMLGLGAAGCAHYRAAAPVLERFPADLQSRRLDSRPSGSVWTGADLLAAAIDRAPSVAEAAAAYRSARAAAMAARVPAGATLNLTAEYSKDAGGTSPWLFGATSDILLDVGTRRSSRVATADLATLQALYDYGEAVWAVRMAIRKAVIDRAFADRETAFAERLVQTRRDRSGKLALRLKAGEDARPPALTAQAELAAADRRLLGATALRRQADVALAKALGLEPAAVRDLNLDPLPSAPAAPTAGDLSAWRAQAALSRRDVLKAVAGYDQAEAALRLEVARQYPAVHVGPGYTWERGVTKLPFTLSLVLPPYDLNKAAIAEAESRRAQAGRALETTQAVALSAVDQADAALAAAASGLELARNQDLPTAQRTDAVARRSLAAGEIDKVDADAAEAAALDAEITALEAARTAWSADADLEDALRRPFDPAETAVLQTAIQRLGSPA